MNWNKIKRYAKGIAVSVLTLIVGSAVLGGTSALFRIRDDIRDIRNTEQARLDAFKKFQSDERAEFNEFKETQAKEIAELKQQQIEQLRSDLQRHREYFWRFARQSQSAINALNRKEGLPDYIFNPNAP